MQTPDLAVDRDPHRGADGTASAVDSGAALADAVAICDKGGIFLTVAR